MNDNTTDRDYEVLIQIHPPESETYPPPRGEFDAWATALDELVTAIGGSRTLRVYRVTDGPTPIGTPAAEAYVNVWTDGGYPQTWQAAFDYAQQRIEAFEAGGYDVGTVDITPGRHVVLIG